MVDSDLGVEPGKMDVPLHDDKVPSSGVVTDMFGVLALMNDSPIFSSFSILWVEAFHAWSDGDGDATLGEVIQPSCSESLVSRVGESNANGDDPLLSSKKFDDTSEYSKSPHRRVSFTVFDIVRSVFHKMACLGGVRLRCFAAMG